MPTRKDLFVAAIVAVGSFAFATTSGAQQPKLTHAAKAQVHVKGDAKLKSEAKVSEADAIATAQKEVPDGKIQSAEIEREGGKLIYSFDIKVAEEERRRGGERRRGQRHGGEEGARDGEGGESRSEEGSQGNEDQAMSSSRYRALMVSGIATLLRVAIAGIAGAQSSAAGYHVTQRIPLGGEGGWDYIAVDTARGRLFISRSDRVMVVDQASGKVLGEITGLNRGHGVAFDYATNHGFATSGADSTVTMFDLGTLAVLKRTIAAVDDDAVLYDPVSKHVFTMNGDANSVSVIDPATGNRVGDIPLGGKPEFGVSDRAGKLYVNLEDKGEVVEVDPVAMKVSRRWSIAPCEEPSGLAIDVAHQRLFSVCGNKLLAVSDVGERKARDDAADRRRRRRARRTIPRRATRSRRTERER